MERCIVADGPARVVPPPEPVAGRRRLGIAIRNPLELLWEAVYREGLHTLRANRRLSVFVTDPDLIRLVLVEDPERYNKSEIFHRVLGPILGEGILTSEGEHWRHQRQIAAPIFRPDRIESYVQQILTSTESEADRLAKMPAGSPISLSDEMKLTTLQIFAATFLSGTYRFDVEAQIEASKTVVGSTGWVIALANIGLPASFPYPGRRRVTAAANYVRRVASDIVTARTHQSREDDLLQSLIDSRDEGSGEAMSDPEIIDNLVTFMSAGHDTAALALTWTFYLLSIHPEVEERVLAEIEDAGGAEGIVPERVSSLAYTRQVISEALRLYPPVPWLLRTPVREGKIGNVDITRRSSIVIPVIAEPEVNAGRLARVLPDWQTPPRRTFPGLSEPPPSVGGSPSVH